MRYFLILKDGVVGSTEDVDLAKKWDNLTHNHLVIYGDWWKDESKMGETK